MEKDNKFWKGALAGALVTAFAGLLIVGLSAGIFLFGSGMIRKQQERKGPGWELQQQAAETAGDQEDSGKEAASGEVESTEQPIDYTQVAVKMMAIQSLIDEYYLFDVDNETVEDTIYLGQLVGLGDMYSTYYSAEEFEELMTDTQGEYFGIGALISQNLISGEMTIMKVYEGTPSEEAGLMSGDKLYKVDGKAVAGESLDVLVNSVIKGEEGTTVEFEVYRPSIEDYVELTITRAKIEVPTVEYEMLADQVGYVAVSQFDVITESQFNEALEDLTSQGMEKLVIDLRNNPGGVLQTAVAMADRILPDDLDTFPDPYHSKGSEGKSLITYTADRNEKGESSWATDGESLEIPIAILVNENSASASEVFTGALKDYDRAVVVGTTTYGKGIVQSVFPLADGSAVKLTTSHYYTPSGKDLHGKGVEADVAVEPNEELLYRLDVEHEEDNQLQAALDVLERGEDAVKAELEAAAAEAERETAEADGEAEEAGADSKKAEGEAERGAEESGAEENSKKAEDGEAAGNGGNRSEAGEAAGSDERQPDGGQ